MIDFKSVKIVCENQNEEILRNLRVLFTTSEGTVPMMRDFGIDTSFLDEPIEAAKGKLTIEYIRKVKKYEPRAKIERVTFDKHDEKLIPRVVVG